MSAETIDVVRRLRLAYDQQDAAAADALLPEDFRFTSPQDDHIDKATWMRVCFPTASRFVHTAVTEWLDHDDVVFSRYEYTLQDGTQWRNMEASTVRDGQVVATEVYFGGRIG